MKNFSHQGKTYERILLTAMKLYANEVLYKKIRICIENLSSAWIFAI